MKSSLIYIILCVLLIGILVNSFPLIEREEFTPGIRTLYRPYERNMREGYNNFYNKLSHRSNMLFRQIGII